MQQYNSYFRCNRCGAQNVVGAATCIYCRENLQYNCPYCSAWVTPAHSHCPACQQPLNWPAYGNSYYIYNANTVYTPGKYAGVQQGTSGKRSILSTLLISLFICAMAIVAVDLMINNSGPSAASSYASSAAPVTGPNNMQPQASIPVKAAAAITLSPVPDTTPTPPQTTITIGTANAYSDQSAIIEYTLPSTTGTTSTTKTSTRYVDTYLQQLDPGWGKCSGGSCRQTCSGY